MRRISIFLLLLFFTKAVYATDDFQYWSQLSLKPYQKDKLDFIIFADSRFTHDAEKMGLYFISPRISYHYSKNLDFGLNYTYLRSRATSPTAIDDSYNWQHRAEMEVNPQWPVKDWLRLKMRNRVEFRWIESRGADNTRYRQRWTFDFPFKNSASLKSIYTSSEFFYDFHSRNLNENRTVPIGLNFKINKKMGLNIYYMIQSQKGTNDWASNQILGTLTTFDF